MIGLLTGLSHVKGHPFKLSLVNSHQCDRCKQASEMASHVVCDCGALATLGLGHLAYNFMEPDDIEDICVSKILHIVRSVGLPHTDIRVAQKSNYSRSAWVTTVPALLLFQDDQMGINCSRHGCNVRFV